MGCRLKFDETRMSCVEAAWLKIYPGKKWSAAVLFDNEGRCLFGEILTNEESSSIVFKQLCAFILKLSAFSNHEEIRIVNINTEIFLQVQILLREICIKFEYEKASILPSLQLAQNAPSFDLDDAISRFIDSACDANHIVEHDNIFLDFQLILLHHRREKILQKGKRNLSMKEVPTFCSNCHHPFHDRPIESELSNSESESPDGQKYPRKVKKKTKAKSLKKVARNKIMSTKKKGLSSESELKIVDNVKMFLEHTKEERLKRGQYMSYDKSERSTIKEYASRYGVKEASSLLSQKQGQPIAESTIRSIATSFNNTSDQLKLQIGEYAKLYGSELASRHFTTLLGRGINVSSCDSYKQMYESALKNMENNKQNITEEQSQDLSIKSNSLNHRKSKSNKDKVIPRGRYVRYDEATRMRIVDYAQLHGVAAASRHFSSELSAPVSESTIRSMREKLIDGKSSQREKGRPAIMGSHDHTLMKALCRLQSSGEKMTTFAIIAVAKQIRDELHEGENIGELSKSWAKSVLKRFNKLYSNKKEEKTENN